jgi:hypothetical protein
MIFEPRAKVAARSRGADRPSRITAALTPACRAASGSHSAWVGITGAKLIRVLPPTLSGCVLYIEGADLMFSANRAISEPASQSTK